MLRRGARVRPEPRDRVALSYTIVDSRLGRLLVAGTDKGLRAVKLGDDDEELKQDLRRQNPRASIASDTGLLSAWAGALQAYVEDGSSSLDLPVDVAATPFQQRVWQALRSIPRGQTRSYAAVATSIGKPSAVRAVARACATNPVCLVVPCHRVIGKNGALTGFRWGVARKQALLAAEQ